MRKIKISLLTLSILVLSSCAGANQMERAKPSLKAYLGGSHGGIIENSDLSLIRPIEPDAFSGATRVGVQAGVHYEYPLKNISLESVGLPPIIHFDFSIWQTMPQVRVMEK